MAYTSLSSFNTIPTCIRAHCSWFMQPYDFPWNPLPRVRSFHMIFYQFMPAGLSQRCPLDWLNFCTLSLCTMKWLLPQEIIFTPDMAMMTPPHLLQHFWFMIKRFIKHIIVWSQSQQSGFKDLSQSSMIFVQTSICTCMLLVVSPLWIYLKEVDHF